MKPFTKLGALIFAIVCIGHAVRLCLKWVVTVNGFILPLWISAIGMIVTAVLSFMLWRESQVS